MFDVEDILLLCQVATAVDLTTVKESQTLNYLLLCLI